MATGVKAAGAAGGFVKAPAPEADAIETVAKAVIGTPPRGYGKPPIFSADGKKVATPQNADQLRASILGAAGSSAPIPIQRPLGDWD